MFSTGLRKKPLWPYLEKYVRKDGQWSLKESTRADFDLSFPLLESNATLYIILIPVTDFESRKIDQSYPLLEKSTLPDRKLVVLVDRVVHSEDGLSGMAMLSRLQMRQIMDLSMAPFVFVSSPDQITRHVDAYLEGLKLNIKDNARPVVDILNVVSSATTSVPNQYLTAQQAVAVCELCPSIRIIEETVRTEHGQMKLKQILDEQTVQNMVQFWKDEWIA